MTRNTYKAFLAELAADLAAEGYELVHWRPQSRELTARLVDGTGALELYVARRVGEGVGNSFCGSAWPPGFEFCGTIPNA